MRDGNELSAAGKRKFSYASLMLVAAIGLALSLGAFQVGRRLERQAVDLELMQETENLASAMSRETWSHALLVEALGALFAGSPPMQTDPTSSDGAGGGPTGLRSQPYPELRTEFRSFVEPFLDRHPSIQALEWIPRVPAQERANYEAKARADGFPGFQITEKDENGVLVRAGERPEYYPVYFLQPYDGNEAALGYDLASNPTRRLALELARDTGQLTATARILLVQGTGDEFGFLLFQPVYRHGTTTDTVEDRRNNLVGFALGVFRIGDIVDKALSYLDWQGLDIALYDQAATPDEQFLVLRAWETRGRALQRSPSRSKATQGRRGTAIVHVAQRQWSVECTATPDFLPLSYTWHSWGLLITGLLSTALAVGYVAALLGRAERARKFAVQSLAAKEKLEYEIAERKRAENALRESERMYRLVTGNISDLIWTCDLQSAFTYVSPSSKHVLGYSDQEMMQLTIDRLMTPESLRVAQDALREEIAGEQVPGNDPFRSHILELEQVRKDGRRIWTSVRAGLLRDETGRAIGVVGMTRDITEQKRAQEKLQESEKHYRLLAENATDIIWTCSIDGLKYDYVSPAVERLLGYTEEECLAMATLAPLTPASKKVALQVIQKALEEQRQTSQGTRLSRTLELEHVRKDGSTVWMEVTGSFLLDGDGQVVGITGITRDVTERKRAEEERQKFVSLVENSNDFIGMADLEGNVFYMNAAGRRMQGLDDQEQLLGITIFDSGSEETRQRVRKEEIPQLMAQGVHSGESQLINRKTGQATDVQRNGFLVRDAETQRPICMAAIMRDITERKRMEEEQQKFVSLVENANDFIGMADLAGNVFYLNPAGRRLVGLERPEEAIGTRIFDYLSGEAARRLRDQDLPVLMTQGAIAGETQLDHLKTGEPIDVQLNSFLVKDQRGEPICIAAVMRDITERKRTEEQRRESQKLFEDIAMSSADIIWEVDADGKYVLALGKTRQILGYEPEEIVGKSPFDLMPEDEAKSVGEIFGRIAAEKKPIVDLENWNITKDGRKVLLLTNAVPILDASGNLCGYRGTDRDITDRKKAEEQLAIFRKFTETAEQGFAMGDLEGRITYSNPALRRMVGESKAEDAYGKTLLLYYPKEMQKRLKDEILPAVMRGEQWHGELALQSTHGEVTPTMENLFTISDENGKPHHIADVIQDMSGYKKMELAEKLARQEAEARAKELARVNRQLERTMEEKEDFLRAVSHDLSAPLRNIAGMASFLKTRYEQVLDRQGQDRLDRIMKNVTMQSGLIGDLLELSRIKTRRRKFERTDLAELVHGLIEQLGFDLEKKSGEVLVEGDFPTVWCEANRMRQVFQNLLDNAIKYAHPERPPRIVISSRRHERNYVFSVSDNGIGIAPEDTEKIFFVFRRARNAYTAQVEGKGVGLASVRTIVETYGGEIGVESREGEGSCFTFTVPEAAVSSPPAETITGETSQADGEAPDGQEVLTVPQEEGVRDGK